jgi:hypothetical protein
MFWGGGSWVEHRLVGCLVPAGLLVLQFSGWNVGWLVVGGLGTLLGPEGAGESLLLLVLHRIRLPVIP